MFVYRRETCTDLYVIVFRVSNETVTTDDFLRGVKEVQREVRSVSVTRYAIPRI